MESYRIQVYLRRKGKTITDGEEFKTELYEDRDELHQAIDDFIDRVINDLEDEEYNASN